MIYLDFASSTPLDQSLQKRLSEVYSSRGNSQSDQMEALHQTLTSSQKKVCAYFNGDPKCLHWTSGATESISTAIIGAARHYHHSGNHLITFETEHSAVLATHQFLAQEGWEVSILPVLPNGTIDLKLLENTIKSNTLLVTMTHINNETGLIHELDPILELRKQHGFMVHLDATQTIGKLPFNIQETPVDYMSLSAHKCYGPQGIGALYMNKNRHIQPLIHGTHPVRSGTVSHALIDLMGEAYQLAKTNLDQDLSHIKTLHQRFLSGISDIPYHLNQPSSSTPFILNVQFPTATPKHISAIRQAIYCQQGSACHQQADSHVLKAMGKSLACIQQSIRFSFGRHTTLKEIDAACQELHRILR